MEQEPRKATDVLLDLESKIDTLLGIVKAQDLNIKVLSNKLNTVMEELKKQPVAPPKITVEAANTTPTPFNQPIPVDTSKQIPVAADFNLAVEDSPTGFRRTSRPETYAGDNAYLNKQAPKNVVQPKFPVQLPPNAVKAEIVVPPNALGRTPGQTFPSSTKDTNKPAKQQIVQNAIPVMQRVVDANGKSVFLADVEITDLSSMEQVFKNRTNGTGKWMASLPIGAYRIVIRKRDAISKNSLEAAQDIQVDGSSSPLDLPLMIIKK